MLAALTSFSLVLTRAPFSGAVATRSCTAPLMMSSWSSPDWKWGCAGGKAHAEAMRLRSELCTPEERQRFLTDVGMMDADDWADSKIVLALKVQRAAKRCFAAQYGLAPEEQDRWREVMDSMASCAFEGYQGDLRLAEAIIERLGLIEGKRLSAL